MSKNGIRSLVISVIVGLLFWAATYKPMVGVISWLIMLASPLVSRLFA
ncbi:MULTISPECIES: hypothetical protein [Raoultella]|jgi:hypothetical protein|uniref:Uncharacterized protein n=1 Tax=Raoultella terrigena TaxID=577 RepID=A0A7Z8Z9A6_RAOTE|nr:MULTISPECIES: hypothetical protein [Raoultella]HDS8977638.1 hypothetical protein [Raoultella ornithinolytica]MCS4271168.1 hypothetical protein [Raoultella sp. BIGb0132]MCS4288523.1 hypothetical protein [Raoultella terrigena]MEB7598730.1 hypothetical protein [Raoultella terrigena]VED49478.1 Uncharacterised protein [Raoultella terrigena]